MWSWNKNTICCIDTWSCQMYYFFTFFGYVSSFCDFKTPGLTLNGSMKVNNVG
jgi:hypothetical protein